MTEILNSAPVANGSDADSEQYNNLRRDLLGHTHKGTTQKVDHTDLLNIGTNGHVTIDAHIAAEAGAHGVPGGYYFVGCGGSGNQVILSGYESVTGGGPISPGSKTITFGVTFAAAPVVLITPHNNLDSKDLYVQSKTVTQCVVTVNRGSEPVAFAWLAIGVLA